MYKLCLVLSYCSYFFQIQIPENAQLEYFEGDMIYC